MTQFFTQINDWIVSSAMDPVTWVILYLFCTIDGFFPPVPSESIVTALAAVYASADPIRILPMTLIAAAGACTGDNIAYLIGSRLHPFLASWKPEFAAKIDAAAAKIEDRGATLLIPARFVPGARVIINMGAGLAEFPHGRFFRITVLSGLIWATYATAIGILAGRWFHDNPLLGAITGVTLGVVIGVVADAVSRHRDRQKAARAALEADATQALADAAEADVKTDLADDAARLAAKEAVDIADDLSGEKPDRSE